GDVDDGGAGRKRREPVIPGDRRAATRGARGCASGLRPAGSTPGRDSPVTAAAAGRCEAAPPVATEVKQAGRCVGGGLRKPIRCPPSWLTTLVKEWHR